MKIEVGAYEAKTKLSELLRQVQEGIEAFKAYRNSHPIGRTINIRDLIEEGR